jgi:hypothetical protein
MGATVGLIVRGGLAGLGLTAAMAVTDALIHRGHLFGLQTGIIGVTAGGGALGLALLMSLASYHLASRNRGAVLRRRLLAGAIWAGAAGMACGLGAITVWLAAGRPWFM